RIIEHAVQTLVQIRHVITAVEKIVDVHLPVTVQFVAAALEKVQGRKTKGSHALDEAPQESLERPGLCVQIDENKFLPRCHANRHQAILTAIEITNAIEIR